MKLTEETLLEKEGYRLHILPSKKYKTINIVAKFKAPLKREGITERALLPHVLQKATNNHPNVRSLQSAFENLYGTALSSDGSKKGENHVISFRMEVVNEAYLNDQEPILEEAFQLFHEVLFDPKMEGEGFDASIVAREKQTLEQKITSIKDDKMSYANMRLMDHMCEEEPYALHVHGYLDDFANITPEKLYSYYKDMIRKDMLDVYVIGDMDTNTIEKLTDKYFSRKESTNVDNDQLSVTKEVKQVNEVMEREEVNQGKLHLGYRTYTKFGDDDYYALQIFNGIFGGFPSSKLFMNVREKHSLAYYAASRFESHKGLLLVFSGVDPKDFDQAKSIILEQMDAMKQGDFTEKQVEETKEQVINQLQETMDNANGLIEVLYHQMLSGAEMPANELIENIRTVTKEQVVQMAKKIELDTIYFLTSNEGGE
ncbi:Predicted Zn-dependent peptidase [Halobacillus karajensis]|uniref:Antilisterial bacteriocin subtilosin biosynthesis protein AlbE n=1 Tax=Halobacillus karajensis TaxID=195088 RepID=A0A024P2J3_9BACI|nr:pitrilysin family protein [Halobacillus karajensis]CDQ19681.1 Antilisterial bacteriocin subtilosin biosynthesis protein AlbE [Halobacillus karajensis]CDQ22141.1 Antilisterial bacteriocin subtilosin biosynthesis protein AlbE [Halobacillus karajensis]CDQ27982.1 Antilisterial bacteriocin subtilosin biosynthesis protein AlbE [Halobacillus karajensis]SEH73933.1 Predicted Zn-dependent peptidase [Halobacillus karajensis]